MAQYEPRALLECWLAGVKRTYLYELADFSGSVFFGLFRNDGTAKPAFDSVANLLTLLQDPGAVFSPGTLSLGLGGSTANVHKLLLQKRDGSFYLVLWVEAPGLDAASLASIAVPTQNVQVILGRYPSAVTEYQFASDGSMSNTALTPSQSISVGLNGSITVLKIQ